MTLSDTGVWFSAKSFFPVNCRVELALLREPSFSEANLTLCHLSVFLPQSVIQTNGFVTTTTSSLTSVVSWPATAQDSVDCVRMGSLSVDCDVFTVCGLCQDVFTVCGLCQNVFTVCGLCTLVRSLSVDHVRMCSLSADCVSMCSLCGEIWSVSCVRIWPLCGEIWPVDCLEGVW